MPRVIHFEIHADDPERASDFYRRAFDWEITNWGGPVDYWLVKTGDDKEPGINGAIMRRVNNGSIWNTVQVPSLEESLEKIVKAGGKIVQEKTTVPGVGYMAYCQDTERNVFGVMQMDHRAK